ncbi:MAG: phage Gp37/Gp68 family protein [Chloroflexi bacterium]|nr:phage Gp37/Gp68 family protein [Chloroflexota bacterium]MCL5074868.1 phage Gp37/Gp68 family protein [Chloroflexota bacterium]
MATKSSIEWTDSTWNPLTGCTKVSPGCKHCYAERMAFRLQAMGQPNYSNGFKLTLHEPVLEAPLSWKKPLMIFVNSMSDLFHEDVPVPFILKVFDVMRRAWWHQFQILTKRSQRLLELNSAIHWPENVWMGVSIENMDYIFRADHLRQTSARTRFLSLEPLLGPLPDLDLHGIHWVIVGGESGPGARPVRENWVTQIREQCLAASVPFFFKQWGGVSKKRAGRLLQGRTWDDSPVQGQLAFRIRDKHESETGLVRRLKGGTAP